ncbi:hypothetical protein EWI61_01210 [Methylolobus aquaticus]|nr:hypothetical protein EWI61_01210 [Methylolobus aquaticus]
MWNVAGNGFRPPAYDSLMFNRSDNACGNRLEHWARLRTLGRSRFIWSYGVLRWGGFMCCFSLAVFHYRQFGSPWSLEGNATFRVILAAIVWAYVGYLYGRSVWNRNERDYAARPTATR